MKARYMKGDLICKFHILDIFVLTFRSQLLLKTAQPLKKKKPIQTFLVCKISRFKKLQLTSIVLSPSNPS